MPQQILIDGNNLLHVMHKHAPLPSVGRETLVRVIERWAEKFGDAVTLVFDGYPPKRGLATQLASQLIDVQFSESLTADDVIVEIIGQVRNPSSVRVVTDDTAIKHEAGCKRCGRTGCVDFIDELFHEPTSTTKSVPSENEKPPDPTVKQTDDWLNAFGFDHDNDKTSNGPNVGQP